MLLMLLLLVLALLLLAEILWVLVLLMLMPMVKVLWQPPVCCGWDQLLWHHHRLPVLLHLVQLRQHAVRR